eukprot:13759398-Ditylum_brightwellii.AAC.1
MDRSTIYWFGGLGVSTLLLKCVQYYLKEKNDYNGISLYATVSFGSTDDVLEGFYAKVGFRIATEEDKSLVWKMFEDHYSNHKYKEEDNVMLTILPELISECVESYRDLIHDL